jgi:hypothetical protein
MIMAFAFLAAWNKTWPFTRGTLELGNRLWTLAGRYFDKSVIIGTPPILKIETDEQTFGKGWLYESLA